MGWKLSVLVLPKVEDPALVVSRMAGVPLRPWREVTLEAVLSKEGYAVAHLGASTLVVGEQAVERAFADDPSPFVSGLRDAGVGSAWALRLHSASNTYGWARFEQGRRVRAVLGDADGRAVRGEPLALEQEVQAMLGHRRHSDTSYVDGAGNVWSHDVLGEEWVMAMMQAVIGIRPDAEEFLEATTTILVPAEARVRGPVRGDELVEVTATLLGWPMSRVRARWEAQVRTIEEQLREGRAELPGILVLMPRRRDAREGRDPLTGEQVTIPASVSVAARVSPEWKSRDLDQAPDVPGGASDEARFIEGVAAVVHGFFFQGAPSVELPSLGQLTVERIEGTSARNPRTGAILSIPPSNRWLFVADKAWSDGLA